MLLLIYVYLQSREKEGEEKGGEEKKKKKDNEINNKRPGPSDKLLFILL